MERGAMDLVDFIQGMSWSLPGGLEEVPAGKKAAGEAMGYPVYPHLLFSRATKN